jgi:carbonic anhydrase
MDIVDELLSRVEPQANYAVPGPPKLGVAILTCMDTRIDPARMFRLQPGDAHVLRNAGGVVTDDVLRSLLLSQRFLGSRAVMVVHHTKCGALDLSDDRVKAEIQAEVGMRPMFALEGFTDLDADVRQSIARIRHCPFLPHRDNIRGFVLDVDDGHLREVV